MAVESEAWARLYGAVAPISQIRFGIFTRWMGKIMQNPKIKSISAGE
jgi:hypothetical protein